MRETIVIVSNVTTGLVLFRKELIEELLKTYEVYIIASDNGRKEQLVEIGAKVIDINIERHGTNPIKELRTVAVFKRIMKSLNPIIVLTYTIKPNIYAGMAAASLGIPYVANITGLGPAVANGGLIQKITIPLYRYGLRCAQKVFFQNKSNLEFMIEKKIASKKQCALLPGSGVNLEKYQVQPYPQTGILEFVFISRIVKEKGIEQYLDAAKEIKKRYPQTCFHICGDCDEKYKNIINEMNNNGIIVYHGKIEDTIAMYRQCCCTIHPSFYPEGMSNVLLESCACGRPIITTDRPGCREVIDDGINGFKVKECDSNDLIEKMEKFISLDWTERKKMGLAERKKVENEFSRKIVIQKYFDEIECLKKNE